MRRSKFIAPVWLPFSAMFAAALYLGLRWTAIPSRWISHWGPGGVPNGWSTKSIGGVFGPLLIGLFLLGVFEVIGAFARAARPLLRSIATAVVALISLLAAMLPFGLARPDLVIGFGLVGIIAAIIIGAIPIVQETKEVAKRKQLRGYESGWFYKNEDDPRLWVPKLMGIGWTINFAHRWAWPVFVLMAGGPLAFVAFVLAVAR